MLIHSDRFLPGDIDVWRERSRIDQITASSPRLARKEEVALDVIRRFFASGMGYVGTSWGKDSVVATHLAWRALGNQVPIVWVIAEPHRNPDCFDVRDAFLGRFGVRYDEIIVHAEITDGEWTPFREIEKRGFGEACKRYGDRHVSGVRADESGIRKIVMKRWGHSTDRTCRPIGWWSGDEVFGYLHKYDLPIHPAYAMSREGLDDRARLRVAWLGGDRGRGFNRGEIEDTYYRDEIERVARLLEEAR